MSKYLLLGGYSPEAWTRMMETPGDRDAAVRKSCQDAGGNMEAFYWAFGADDYVLIADFPDDVSAGAFSVGLASSGALHDVRTIKLITKEEGQALLGKGKAVAAGYQKPGA